MTAVSTDTLTKSCSVTISIVSEVSATEDALPGLEVRFERADVGLVHVVDDDGGHGDDLRRAGGHDGHQDEEEDGVLSSGSQQLLGHQRSCESLHDIVLGQHGRPLGGGEAQVGQAHGSGQGEGDREPDQASRDETPDTLEYKQNYFSTDQDGKS